MKAEWVNPFIDATMSVFTTMVSMDPVKGEVYLKKDDTSTFDVSGIIGIAGEATGSIVISMPADLALDVVANFLGERKDTLDSDVTDAIGELTNMIAGNAKKAFTEMGMKFKISIPSVVTGHQHKLSRPANVPCIGVSFTMSGKRFVIEVALKQG